MKKIIEKIILSGICILIVCSSCTKNNNDIEPSIIDTETESIEEMNEREEKDNSSSLLYIMPKYKEEIYSKAYFRQFVKTKLSELRECYGQLAEKLNNEQMDKAEKSVAMKNYEQIEDFVLKAERNEIDQDTYDKLPQTKYLSQIVKETKYDKKESLSRANFAIKIDTIETYDLYYSFECDTYRPYLISKKDIEELKKIFEEDEEEATKIVELPINKAGIVTSRGEGLTNKKIKLYYDGDKGFLYYVNGKEVDKNLREISIKEHSGDYYAFYEDDEYVIEHPEKSIVLNILKDANIGQGNDFKQIALAEDEYAVGDDDRKYYYEITDLLRRIVDNENTIMSDKNIFVGNYLKFDAKGYVTDFYNFTEIE